MLFGAHHEWGRLREVVIGISPAEDFVVFHEDSCRWLTPEGLEFSRRHAGQRLIDVDPEKATRLEPHVDAPAELVECMRGLPVALGATNSIALLFV